MVKRRSNNRAKGTYYKRRTRLWLERLGYHVENLEKTEPVFLRDKDTGETRVVHTRRDTLGADLLALNDEDLIFVQSKLGTANVAAAATIFSDITLPRGSCIRQWIVCWEPRAREPRVVEVTENEYRWL